MAALSAIHAPERICPQPPLRLRVARRLLIAIIRILFNVRVIGAENAPRTGYVALGNHLGWIDPLMLLAALPAAPHLYFIGAKQAFKREWQIRLLQFFDITIPFERGAGWLGKDALNKPVQVLETGASLAFFPEGDSFPDEGVLHPLQRGIGHFLLRAPAGVPILPIALSGTRELYWRKPVTVIIGKPFCVKTEGLNHRAAIDAAVEQVTRQISAILPPYIEPNVKAKHMHFLTDWLD